MRSPGEGRLDSLQSKTNRIFKSSKKHKGFRFKVIKIMGVLEESQKQGHKGAMSAHGYAAGSAGSGYGSEGHFRNNNNKKANEGEERRWRAITLRGRAGVGQV